ncbi:MAG: hypothetical protein IRZ16_17875 [Myxococcaceae bacterium]|nr:hypothetical protein [Myxococcaceae bacterium]
MKKILGALAAAALLSTPAWANDSGYGKGQQEQQQQKEGTGGSGSTEMKSGQMETEMEQPQKLSGKVLKMERQTLYIQDDSGAAVPVAISSRTKFKGLSRKDLKEGTEVDAEFKIKDKIHNEAESISMGTGGSGQSGSMENQGGTFDTGSTPQPTVPEDESQGPAEPQPSGNY